MAPAMGQAQGDAMSSKDHPLDPARCQTRVSPRQQIGYRPQCKLPVVKNGLCARHQPEAVAARHDEAMADVVRAKAAFDRHRDRQEALGAEACLVVVGYVSGRDPFRLLGRVSADTGEDALPNPPLTTAEMQSVAYAAKMALGKVLSARRRSAKRRKTP